MELTERVTKLEALGEKTVERLTSLERDVAVIASNYATKADVSAVTADIHNLAANMHKDLHALTWKLFGVCGMLVAVVYFIATHAK